ncbi:hypothetical protein GCM10017559_71890 [Streptosporangium longisporum]|uniref:Uncharacterized protein n=1 Tax=Streptosporangium longisporum TaxID=46187 RepID=A0ABP6L6M3_9ACTN
MDIGHDDHLTAYTHGLHEPEEPARSHSGTTDVCRWAGAPHREPGERPIYLIVAAYTPADWYRLPTPRGSCGRLEARVS